MKSTYKTNKKAASCEKNGNNSRRDKGVEEKIKKRD